MSGSSKGFLVVLVVLALLVFGGLRRLTAPAPEPSGTAITIEIPDGAGVRQVASILAEQGVISNAFLFSARARFDDRADDIRPGTYQLPPGADASAILDVLASPAPVIPVFTVTIPEGLTVGQTLARVAEAEGSPFTLEQLAAALPSVPLPPWVPVATIPAAQPYPGQTVYEGLLFPNTYEFRQDAAPQDVLGELVAQTGSVLDGLGLTPDQDRYQVLVIGSLIEREARLAEERPVISSVIRNRLAEGIGLQVDASVLYAAGRAGENAVRSEDLELDTPWNTYAVAGLPPTPISGAGQSSLEAAARPQDTGFFYYVVSDPATGQHAFAATLAEHNQNVARFRDLQSGG